MKILIAEDSDQKIEELNQFLSSFGRSDFTISVSRSFKESIKLILSEQFDLVILDMSMPTKSGSLNINNRSLAGRDILSTVRFNRLTQVKFVIFSQFGEFGRHDEVVSLSEIYESLIAEHGDIIIGYVKYDSSSDSWKKSLKMLLKGFL